MKSLNMLSPQVNSNPLSLQSPIDIHLPIQYKGKLLIIIVTKLISIPKYMTRIQTKQVIQTPSQHLFAKSERRII